MNHTGGGHAGHMHHPVVTRHIAGNENTGHIIGHLIPGLALFIGGVCLTHVVCSEVITKPSQTYKRVSNGENESTKDVEGQDVSVFKFYSHGSSYDERPADRFKLKMALVAVAFILCGILLEGFGGVYAGFGFFFQAEHIILYSTYLPFLVLFMLESGQIKAYSEFTRYAPVPSQFCLSLAFFANSLLWEAHLKMKKPGWDYDGHEAFVVITKGAYLMGALFVFASLADKRKLANAVYLFIPMIGLLLNGSWLLTHTVLRVIMDVDDPKLRIQELGYPLFIVQAFVVSICYLAYVRRRYLQVFG